ncbi:MAG TPA: helix-turn-helix transcriptional regulator [Gaiellaceae bacterium]|nr:helix-turn-helix transcriptional regulator [Gaiellaceae bacterium]
MSAAEKVPSRVFATNMRRARHRRGLSQERLAYACRLHRTEISLLERGQRDPRLSTIVKLARALGCTPSSLLEEVN